MKRLALIAYLACGALIMVFTIPAFGLRALNVVTPSMKPAVSPGDLVLVRRVPVASLRPGQIVTYADPHHTGVTITHRVVSAGRVRGVPTVITKGDANAADDAAVPAGRIVGRVVAVVPGLGRAFGWLRNPVGLLALVIIPGLIVIWSEVKHLRRLLRSPERRRRLDGLYRPLGLAVAVGLVALATGTTLAQVSSTAHLIGNSFTVSTTSPSPTPTPSGSPSPTPSPSGSPTPSSSPCANLSITNTGPGSTNIITCTNTVTTSSSGRTHITVTNSTHQTSTAGGSTTTQNTTVQH